MNREDVVNKLKAIQKNEDEIYDAEDAHLEADKLLCDYLKHLGYSDIVEEFEKIDKWYA